MPKDKAIPVTPKPAYHEYVDENLKVVEVDLDNILPGWEDGFKEGANLEEGVAGLKAIDTLYENTSEDIVDYPRSDRDDSGKTLRGLSIEKSTVRHPAPHPMDLHRFPQRRL